MNISKRGLARIITFAAAITITLAAFTAQNHIRAMNAERAVENSYVRAVEELSLDLDNIKNNLQKGMYTNSISMLSELSDKLRSDASDAKMSLSQLPVDELDLTSAYKFLSQVGNYSKSLADKCSKGQQLTEEETENIAKLYEYAKDISAKMWAIENRIGNGEISFADIIYAASALSSEQPSDIINGFTDLETDDDSFPKLIYDGPYSDHIMEKEPLMLKNCKEIKQSEALRLARKLAEWDELELLTEEGGKMPSYVFSGHTVTAAVTKQGGMYSYMISHRPVGKAAITAQDAENRAIEYLADLGIRGLDKSYYEIRNGICIINFAATQNGVTMYTDLIKVGVALDNGDIVSFDMRGYLTNHTIRSLPSPKISAQRAEQLVSSKLSVLGSKLCVIPSSGQNELFCYEVKCVGKNGENILVYINAETGREEELLILKIGSGGVLTV